MEGKWNAPPPQKKQQQQQKNKQKNKKQNKTQNKQKPPFFTSCYVPKFDFPKHNHKRCGSCTIADLLYIVPYNNVYENHPPPGTASLYWILQMGQ